MNAKTKQDIIDGLAIAGLGVISIYLFLTKNRHKLDEEVPAEQEENLGKAE